MELEEVTLIKKITNNHLSLRCCLFDDGFIFTNDIDSLVEVGDKIKKINDLYRVVSVEIDHYSIPHYEIVVVKL